MKKILLGCLMSFILSAGYAQGINFSSYKTWSEVLALSKKENKLIFVETYTTRCGYCQYMMRSVFPLASVGKYYNDNFISVTVDIEKGEGIELAQRYSVKAVPTLLFLDAEGRLVHSSVGAINGPTLIAHGKAALAPYQEAVNE